MVDKLLQFIEQHFLLCFAFAVLWNFAFPAIMQWRRSRHGLQFPSLDTVNVLFRERFASGCSHRSLWTRYFGGAQNCLSITLTKEELWVTSFFPFTTFLGFFDLEYRIPMKYLIRVDRKGKKVVVDFETTDSKPRRVVLRLRKAEEFFNTIDPLLDN